VDLTADEDALDSLAAEPTNDNYIQAAEGELDLPTGGNGIIIAQAAAGKQNDLVQQVMNVDVLEGTDACITSKELTPTSTGAVVDYQGSDDFDAQSCAHLTALAQQLATTLHSMNFEFVITALSNECGHANNRARRGGHLFSCYKGAQMPHSYQDCLKQLCDGIKVHEDLASSVNECVQKAIFSAMETAIHVLWGDMHTACAPASVRLAAVTQGIRSGSPQFDYLVCAMLKIRHKIAARTCQGLKPAQ
jgi:hypothetical protein